MNLKLGDLQHLHIFEYYDMPLLFTMRSKTKFYIFYIVEEKPMSIWMIAEITKKEMKELLKKKVGILTLLKSKIEKDELYEVMLSLCGEEVESSKVINDLDYYGLPEEDFILEELVF